MPPPPSLNGAHAARNKRKLGDHRPRAKRNRSLPSSLPLPNPNEGYSRTEEGERAKEEEEEVGFIMARQETNLSQLQCWPCCREGRKRPMQSVRLLFQCDTKEASGRLAELPVGAGGSEFF